MGFRDFVRNLSTPPTALEASVQQSLPTHADWLAWANFDPINVTSAMSMPGVFRANVLIRDLSSQVDWIQEEQVIDRDGTVRWEREARPFPIIRRPNLDEPASETIAAAVGQLTGPGEGFILLGAHDTRGRPHTAEVIPHNDEIDLDWDDARMRPIIKWRGRKMQPWRDIVHLKHLALPGKLHGVGPIQAYERNLIGSGDVEEWTRSFFTDGGQTATTITHPGDATPTEITEIKDAWMTSRNNKLEPAVLFGGATASNDDLSPDKAQALETRRYNVQMSASMYGLNPYMLAIAMSGANITYQTLPDLFAEAIRLTIYPTYLRKIETAFSELLPRGHRVRFDLPEFLKTDEKTRMETAKIGIDSGVHTADEWRARENLPPRKDPANASPDA